MRLATILIWVACSALVARVTWWLVEPSGSAKSVAVSALDSDYVSSTTGKAVNIEQIKALNLFGEPQKQSSRQRKNAPQTSLNIRLVGVSASSNPLRSAAIIEQGGNQQVYIVGDTIERSRVKVEEIYADRVMLNNNGRIETLQLEDIGEKRPALSLIVNSVPESANNEQSSDSAATEADSLEDVSQQVQQDPQSLTDYVSITPAVEQGKLQGYRLQAGSNPQLFRQAGFQDGDLATAINGYDLTDMQQAMQLTNELATMTRVNVQIVRDGQSMELELELPQSQDN